MIPLALAFGAVRTWLTPILAGTIGWIFADWRRIAVVLWLVSIGVTYVVADQRRAAADRVETQQKLDRLTHDFITAADRAKADEAARQAKIAADAAATFQRQLAARDAAQATADAATEQEIKNYEPRLASLGRSCRLGPDDLMLLDPHAAASPSRH